jgi:hypothetical protein
MGVKTKRPTKSQSAPGPVTAEGVAAPKSRISRDLALKFVECLARPVIRFAIQHGVKVREFTELSKKLACEVALAELSASRNQRDPNVSRVSLVTGLHRKDVQRILEGQVDSSDRESQAGANRVGNIMTRIIGRWLSDSNYRNGKNQPRPLGCVGIESEFAALVGSVSKELSFYSVIHELERTGSIIRDGDKLQLVAPEYVPSADASEGFAVIGDDIEDLIAAGELNILSKDKLSNVQLKTHYDNIPAKDLEKIRSWLNEEARVLHQRLRDYLGSFDRDLSGKTAEIHSKSDEENLDRFRVAFGTYSVIESFDEFEKKRNRNQDLKNLSDSKEGKK